MVSVMMTVDVVYLLPELWLPEVDLRCVFFFFFGPAQGGF